MPDCAFFFFFGNKRGITFGQKKKKRNNGAGYLCIKNKGYKKHHEMTGLFTLIKKPYKLPNFVTKIRLKVQILTKCRHFFGNFIKTW